MGWFANLLGGGVKPLTEAAGEVADIVSGTRKAKAEHEMDMETDKLTADGAANARAMQLPSHESWIDIVVDGFNRLIRPGVTVILVGSVCGWWKLPDPGTLDPFYLVNAERVLIFWFGGRALFRDLPDAIAYYKNTVKRG